MADGVKVADSQIRQQRMRRLAAVEVAAGIAIIWGNVAGILPYSSTPFLLLLAWISLRMRRAGWRSLGLAVPKRWLRTTTLAVVTGSAYQLLSLYVIEPLLARLTGALPDASLFSSLSGNVPALTITLLIVWTLAALGEELTMRGYLANRVATLLGDTSNAWVLAIVVTSLLFGLGHVYQGASGVLDNLLAGLVFGTLYLVTDKNLLAPIIAHGTFDTVAAVLLFLGKYPGR